MYGDIIPTINDPRKAVTGGLGGVITGVVPWYVQPTSDPSTKIRRERRENKSTYFSCETWREVVVQDRGGGENL